MTKPSTLQQAWKTRLRILRKIPKIEAERVKARKSYCAAMVEYKKPYSMTAHRDEANALLMLSIRQRYEAEISRCLGKFNELDAREFDVRAEADRVWAYAICRAKGGDTPIKWFSRSPNCFVCGKEFKG